LAPGPIWAQDEHAQCPAFDRPVPDLKQQVIPLRWHEGPVGLRLFWHARGRRSLWLLFFLWLYSCNSEALSPPAGTRLSLLSSSTVLSSMHSVVSVSVWGSLLLFAALACLTLITWMSLLACAKASGRVQWRRKSKYGCLVVLCLVVLACILAPNYLPPLPPLMGTRVGEASHPGPHGMSADMGGLLDDVPMSVRNTFVHFPEASSLRGLRRAATDPSDPADRYHNVEPVNFEDPQPPRQSRPRRTAGFGHAVSGVIARSPDALRRTRSGAPVGKGSLR
jgi:hypothetical protein